MKILVSGASGLIGSALTSALEAEGHEVRKLVRSTSTTASESQWDPYGGNMEPGALDGIDAVIHLSGQSILSVPWNERKKQAIRDSRIETTAFICRRLIAMPTPPKVWLCASAIGYYGDRGDERLDEDSGPGSGFFSALCQDWEAATAPASEHGVRVINLRLGLVFSGQGGVLQTLRRVFNLALGGVVGSGNQYVSWIAIDDVCAAVNLLLQDDAVRGPVNLVAPNPVTNRELTKTLGRVLSRPAVLPVPAFALRLVAGELADEALLASARVYPKRLSEKGYEFQYPTLEPTLRHLIGA